MAIIEVTRESFEQEVLNSEKPVLADFNAGWCGPCRMLKPILEEIAAETDAFKVVSIDIDEEDELAEQYDVSSIPCLLVFKGGEEVDRSVGLIPKEAILSLMEG